MTLTKVLHLGSKPKEDTLPPPHSTEPRPGLGSGPAASLPCPLPVLPSLSWCGWGVTLR